MFVFILFSASCSKENDTSIIHRDTKNKINSNVPIQKSTSLMEGLSFSLELSYNERIELIEPLLLNLGNYPNTSLQFSVDLAVDSVEVIHVEDTTFSDNITYRTLCTEGNLHLCNQWAMSRLDEGCALSAHTICNSTCSDGTEYHYKAVC